MSARVWIISNIYGDLEDEIRNRAGIIKWRYESETEEKFEQLGFAKEYVKPPLIADRSQKYQVLTPSGLIRPCTRMIAKGCAVLNHFNTLLQQEYGLKDEDIIVYFDGDKQVEYDQVFKLVEKLKTSKFVLCNRGNSPGIPEERFLIEKFENSFIEDAFSITLPDVQCGCWGVTGKHLKDIYDSLTAEAFEIELVRGSEGVAGNPCPVLAPETASAVG